MKAGKSLTKPLVIGPDAESERWAARAAELLGTDYDVLEKTRVSAKEIHIRPRELDAKGRDVLIIDDIVSTGGTIMEVIKSLKAQGAGRITAACTHAVLSDIDTLDRLVPGGHGRVHRHQHDQQRVRHRGRFRDYRRQAERDRLIQECTLARWRADRSIISQGLTSAGQNIAG